MVSAAKPLGRRIMAAGVSNSIQSESETLLSEVERDYDPVSGQPFGEMLAVPLV